MRHQVQMCQRHVAACAILHLAYQPSKTTDSSCFAPSSHYTLEVNKGSCAESPAIILIPMVPVAVLVVGTYTGRPTNQTMASWCEFGNSSFSSPSTGTNAVKRELNSSIHSLNNIPTCLASHQKERCIP